MEINKLIRPSVGADLSRPPPIMRFNKIIRVSMSLHLADKSAVGAINRPLHCHPERSEGSVAIGSEILRFAQDDIAGTHPDAWINVFLSMIGPYGWLE